MDNGTSPGPTIVVGVDGSDSSVVALRWAARQARLAGAALSVVAAWDYPEHPTPFGIVPDLPASFDPVDATRQALDALVENVLGADPGIDVRCTVMHGAPAPVLLDAAKAAQLLVVGGRGRRSLTGALLGSVSRHCVTHAPCPVAVIRGSGS
ncbi:MAG TPA: universal stress protein [Acidimicrobiales bacterium]|nr:universal stress protein [Acidimicrobiales bacterium]